MLHSSCVWCVRCHPTFSGAIGTFAVYVILTRGDTIEGRSTFVDLFKLQSDFVFRLSGFPLFRANPARTACEWPYL